MNKVKCYQVVVEDCRDQYEEPSVYVNDVHVNLYDALMELNDIKQDALTNEEGDFGWLASAMLSHPSDIKTEWPTERQVIYKDTFVGDRLSIYVNEVDVEVENGIDLRDSVMLAFGEYVARFNEQPNYAKADVLFKDGSDMQQAIIALHPYDPKKDDDDEIFYYCSGMCDFARLTRENAGDFTITNFIDFYDAL